MTVDYTDTPTDELFAERYLIERLLGEGGMGRVYLASDTLLQGDKVALKLLHREFCSDERHVARFLREVQLTRKVTHPNIVRTFEAGSVDGLLFFTMEYAPGATLKQTLSGGPLNPHEVIRVLIEVCKGLGAIHELGIVHRDLKPGNVIVQPDGSVKLTDFGVARAGVSDVTAFHEIVGSIAYMAPEIWRAQPLTPAVDLYALGVMAYELLLGSLPFNADAPAEMMCKHLEQKPPIPAEVRGCVPGWLSLLVMRLLAKEPAARPASAAEVERLLGSKSAYPALQPPGLSLEQPAVPISGKTLRGAADQSAPAAGVNNVRIAEQAYAASVQEGAPSALSGRVRVGVVRQRAKLHSSQYPSVMYESSTLESFAAQPKRFASSGLSRLLISLSLAYALGWLIAVPLTAFERGLIAAPGLSASLWRDLLFSFVLPLFTYMLLAVTPVLMLASLKRTLRTSLHLAWRMASVLLLLFAALYLTNIMRVRLGGALYQPALHWQIFRDLLQPTFHNFVEAAMLLPFGTPYVPSTSLGESSLMVATVRPVTGYLSYYCFYIAYLYVLMRFIMRDVLRMHNITRVAVAGNVCSFAAAVFSVYYVLQQTPAPALRAIWTLWLGPFEFHFGVAAAVAALFSWAFLGLYVVLNRPAASSER